MTIMALVEEGVRQQLRQRFSDLPEPVFDECLRTNHSNLTQCIRQLRERSEGGDKQDPMCAVSAGMDPASHYHPHHHSQPQDLDTSSLSTRENSDGWIKLDWPPDMHPSGGVGGGGDFNQPHNRTPESNDASSGWNDYRQLYRFKPPVQVSKISVSLTKQPGPAQTLHSNVSPVRTHGVGNGSRTPGTPDSSGLDVSINLPGVSPPPDRSPSPSINPFFPPSDPNDLRASLSSERLNFHEGRSSPGVVYPPGNSASPRHGPSSQNSSPSTPPSPYNSNIVPAPAVVQPAIVSSHRVAPPPLNNPSPDVRRKFPTHPTDSPRWAEQVTQRPVGMYPGVGQGPNAQVIVSPTYNRNSSHQVPPSTRHDESPGQRQALGSQEEQEYNQALILHQNARKERLKKDLEEEKGKLSRMRSEISNMEQDLNTKRSHRGPFPSADQLNRLREEKRQLQIDIECMNKEIELFKKQGYGDPQGLYFYDNMGSTGPNGPIPTHGPPAPRNVQPMVLDPEEGQQWSCTHCTFLNHPFLDKCECCEMPREGA